MVKCQKCDRIILDVMQDGGYKLRTRMILFKEGKTIALCPTCKAPVEVPVFLNSTDIELPKPKLVISRKE